MRNVVLKVVYCMFVKYNEDIINAIAKKIENVGVVWIH
jgi:hypothetical protein